MKLLARAVSAEIEFDLPRVSENIAFAFLISGLVPRQLPGVNCLETYFRQRFNSDQHFQPHACGSTVRSFSEDRQKHREN